MRLIDADKIIKWADDSVSQHGGTYSTDMLNMFGLFKHIIDNAPTVPYITKEKLSEVMTMFNIASFRKGLQTVMKTERKPPEIC